MSKYIFNVCNLFKCIHYADDAVLIISCDNIVTLFSNAYKYFAMFSKWFFDNKLALNAKKTIFVLLATTIELLIICPNELHFDIYFVNHVDYVSYLVLLIVIFSRNFM